MPVSRRLLAALIAIALFAITAPGRSATAQVNECDGSEWTAADAAELAAAVGCWENATEPGDYTITLVDRIFVSSQTVPAQSADFSLTIDGSTALEGAFIIVGAEGLGPTAQSPFVMRIIAVRGVTATGVALTLSEASVVGEFEAIDSHVTLRRSNFSGLSDRALRLVRTNALIEDSIVSSGLDLFADGNHPAMSATDSVVILRNSMVRGSDGAFQEAEGSEILFDRSLVMDNDVSTLSNEPCCRNSTVSYINSTVTSHDGQAPFNVTIGEVDGALVNIANSTLIDNGPHSALGPIDTRSSIIDACRLESVRRPPADFTQAPIDLGGNVGGCFDGGLIEHFPLDDYGCARPTPLGCVPTIATMPTSPARGSGQCDATLIPDPTVDLFAIDVATLPAGTDSVLTTIGRQTLDGRGFPRSSCDAGAYESDGDEPLPPGAITVATLDLDHPFSQLNVLPAPRFYVRDIGQWLQESSIDVLLLQRVAGGPLGGNTIDALMTDLAWRGYPMVYDYVPAFALDPELGTSVGQAILSRFPMVERSSTVLSNPAPEGRPGVIQEVRLSAPVRILNVRTFDDDPCGHVQALDALLDDSAYTTIVGGNLGADRTRSCVGEFAAGMVDACAAPPVDAACERTIAPGTDIADSTQDYLLHSTGGQPMRLVWAETQPVFVLDPPTPHWPVVAKYWFAGPADTDDDGIIDAFDQCPTLPGSGGDRDSDGVGDVCDPILDGDANCDDSRNIIDALVIAQFDAGLRTDAASCAIADQATELYAYGADANNDGTTNIIDALLIAQCDAGLDNAACPVPPPD